MISENFTYQTYGASHTTDSTAEKLSKKLYYGGISSDVMLCPLGVLAVCVQGTCSVSAVGAVSCACPAQWAGERCQRPACVDAACRAPDTHNHTHNTDNDSTAHDNGTRNNSKCPPKCRPEHLCHLGHEPHCTHNKHQCDCD